MIELPLRSLLSSLDPDRLGFTPEKVPAHVTTRLPVAVIKPQLSRGSVVVPISLVAEGCEARFLPAFAQADPDLEVKIPVQDVYHNLPAGALAPSAAPGWGSASPSFEVREQEDAPVGRRPEPEPEPGADREQEPEPAPSPFGLPAGGGVPDSGFGSPPAFAARAGADSPPASDPASDPDTDPVPPPAFETPFSLRAQEDATQGLATPPIPASGERVGESQPPPMLPDPVPPAPSAPAWPAWPGSAESAGDSPFAPPPSAAAPPGSPFASAAPYFGEPDAPSAPSPFGATGPGETSRAGGSGSPDRTADEEPAATENPPPLPADAAASPWGQPAEGNDSTPGSGSAQVPETPESEKAPGSDLSAGTPAEGPLALAPDADAPETEATGAAPFPSSPWSQASEGAVAAGEPAAPASPAPPGAPAEPPQPIGLSGGGVGFDAEAGAGEPAPAPEPTAAASTENPWGFSSTGVPTSEKEDARPEATAEPAAEPKPAPASPTPPAGGGSAWPANPWGPPEPLAADAVADADPKAETTTSAAAEEPGTGAAGLAGAAGGEDEPEEDPAAPATTAPSTGTSALPPLQAHTGNAWGPPPSASSPTPGDDPRPATDPDQPADDDAERPAAHSAAGGEAEVETELEAAAEAEAAALEGSRGSGFSLMENAGIGADDDDDDFLEDAQDLSLDEEDGQGEPARTAAATGPGAEAGTGAGAEAGSGSEPGSESPFAEAGSDDVFESGERLAGGFGPDLEDDLSFGYADDDPNQIALRAVFGTDETLSLERAVDLSGSLPGISACVFFDGERAVSSGSLGDGGDFSERAPKVFASVRDLAAAMGIGNATTFTIRTECGIMSFFTEGERCLGVLHENAGFLPGVREKLTLVSQGLAGLALPS